ncbi:asparagine synthase (glutamine-hydrolyzing) [candidate division KSB1 bacterium 4572_119]|nr:MAG: asparagine synthase (glutamine-hydrolyzing) [candidate division KSB1 bacterium 4572_119]
MIAGILYAKPEEKIDETELFQLFDLENIDKSKIRAATNKNMAVAFCPSDVKTIDNGTELWHDTKNTVLFSGNAFNSEDIIGTSTKKETLAESLFNLYLEKKGAIFNEINGNYVLSFWQSEKQEMALARDHLGIEPLYYYWNEEKLIFASSIKAILRHPDVKSEISFKSLYTYLLFNYNPASETLIKGIKKLRPGQFLRFAKEKLSIERYWYLSFAQDQEKTEEQFVKELLPKLKKSVKIRLEKEKSHGAFLSGGMDSSTMVGLMSPEVQGKIHTFSFRCKGKSFDESHYAKIVSDRYGTDHQLVEFDSDEVLSIKEIVKHMDEPFCDIGIEVASYLLGKNAKGKTSYVLTGDGGDELFAGHPVYQADKVAQKFSKIPKPLQKMMTGLFSLFPDTDKKKSFAVKAQRFAYSYRFPEELFSNRWRVYYQQSEMTKLFTSDYRDKILSTHPLDDITAIYKEADGTDFLSKTLYGDYHTVVSFYLRRMQLLRSFGIEARFPMFDPRLVEYAAKIPSELKLRGNETKYILHKTMAGVLPDEIVFRKDKLGHSVPFKNWLRDVPEINNLIKEVLSEESIKKRGYFNPAFVQRLLTEHFKRKKNNSHRLWALLVLELWMRENLDK